MMPIDLKKEIEIKKNEIKIKGMKEVLDVSRGSANCWWIILECGHWYKWTGRGEPPSIGTDLRCPNQVHWVER